jgi:AbrB family looped-hinge helix DNA binding protein
MNELIEMGKISSRGQISIPSDIRNKMGLEEGTKVLFLLENDTLLIKRIHERSFAEITKPLRAAKKKIKENEVTDLIHRLRKSKND